MSISKPHALYQHSHFCSSSIQTTSDKIGSIPSSHSSLHLGFLGLFLVGFAG